MAEDSLKDFTINWMLTGFLMFALVAFATVFMISNNPIGLGDDASETLGIAKAGFESQLVASSDDAERILNTTSNTNPEVSDLGGRDIVSTSYEVKGSYMDYWTTAKSLASWVFSGTIGSMLLAVFAGIIGFLSYFYIMKHIRTGT